MIENRFKADEWLTLAPSERIYRCYAMAKEAQELARGSPPELAQAYRELSEQLCKLALEIAASELPPN